MLAHLSVPCRERKNQPTMPEHLDSDLVAAYAERRLNPEERSRVEAHTAECAQCRRELTDVAVELAAVRRRRRLFVTAPLATAALLALIFVNNRSAGPGRNDELLRPGTGAGDAPLSLPAHAPEAGAGVTRTGLRFVWGGRGPDALYDLTLADSSGLALWRARTSDTTLAVPDSVALAAGARYHWWVDVLLADGRVASTGNREFVIQP